MVSKLPDTVRFNQCTENQLRKSQKLTEKFSLFTEYQKALPKTIQRHFNRSA